MILSPRLTRHLAACLALAAASAAALAAPVTRQCQFRDRTLHRETVAVTVDESARVMVLQWIGSPVVTYRDGVTGPLVATSGVEAVAQIVRILPDQVEVVTRSPVDGSPLQLLHVNRAAFGKASAPCLVRSLWRFGEG
jgi:hypothetical protein